MKKTRYEWTQEQRRVETAIRREKDVGIAAQAAGDNALRREAQTNINALTEYYEKISEKAGVSTDYSRTRVEGYKAMSKREIEKVTTSISFQTTKSTDNLNNKVFRTKDDPIREKIGSAYDSHPNEVALAVESLKTKGVEIVHRDSAMAYAPGLRKGRPGILIIDKNASYSAWLHEITHIKDDEASGWDGMRLLINPETAIKMETHAYDIEIDFARNLGYNDVVERLERLKQERIEALQDG